MAAGLGAYARVLEDPRARAFSAAGLLARLPMSMTGLGIVLLISITTGSFGRAGLVVAALTVGGALAAPWWGRAIDRIGQARVLITAGVLNSLSLSLVIISVLLAWPLGVSMAAALGAGLGGSMAGSAVRARWSHRLSGSPLLNTAYALEAVLDEVVFIVGPVLATFLATTVHPALGVATGMVVGLVGAVLLAGLRDTEPPVRPRRDRVAAKQPLSAGVMAPLVAAYVALGSLFGGMEVVIVAFAKESGVLPYAGFFVMAWASGSLVAGVVTGAITWRATPAKRFRIAAIALGVSVLPLPFAAEYGPVLLVAGLLLLSGLAIAPTIVASTAVTQSSVPASRLTEALAWTTSGIAGGLALGSAALGKAIDAFGAVGGLWGVVIVGAVLVIAAFGVRNRPLAAAAAVEPSAQPGDANAVR